MYGEENVYDFSLGNPDADPPEPVLAAMERLIRQKDVHKYMSNAGFPAVRAKIAAHVSKGLPFEVPADNVVMTVGAAGGLNTALKALLDPGDEAIVLSPYFAEYLFYIRNHGGVPVVVPTAADTFEPDPAAVAAAVTPRTRALILNNPNNPTGTVYSRGNLSALAAALPSSVCVLSDEPYARLVYDAATPSVLEIFDNAMIITSFSKSLALPGGSESATSPCPPLRRRGYAHGRAVFRQPRTGIRQRALADAAGGGGVAGHGGGRRRLSASKEIFIHEIVTAAGFECRLPQGRSTFFHNRPSPTTQPSSAGGGFQHSGGAGQWIWRAGIFRLAYCVGWMSSSGRGTLPALGRGVWAEMTSRT